MALNLYVIRIGIHQGISLSIIGHVYRRRKFRDRGQVKEYYGGSVFLWSDGVVKDNGGTDE